TLEGGSDLPADDQIWYWKELGTLVGLVGMVLLLFPVGVLLLRLPFFAEVRGAARASRGARGRRWWAAALVTMLLGPLTLFSFKSIPDRIGWGPSALFPQSITNAIIAWTTLVALITLALFAVWHFASNRGAGGAGDSYGLTWSG